MTTDNMRLIMAKVRAHIMTGQSASTPAFTFTKPTVEQKTPEELLRSKLIQATIQTDDRPSV